MKYEIKIRVNKKISNLEKGFIATTDSMAPNSKGLYNVYLDNGDIYNIHKKDIEFLKKETLFAGWGVIRTYSGKYINVLDPHLPDIDVEDIAHVLSMQCRFGGNLYNFYSIAQHCCIMYDLAVTPANKKAALLHDASEAYLMDIACPIKRALKDYKKIEDRFMNIIAEKYMFQYPLNDFVNGLDRYMLEQEWQQLMIDKNKMLVIDVLPKAYPLWDSKMAKREFLFRFMEIF